jgi:hypothetical protein
VPISGTKKLAASQWSGVSSSMKGPRRADVFQTVATFLLSTETGELRGCDLGCENSLNWL